MGGASSDGSAEGLISGSEHGYISVSSATMGMNPEPVYPRNGISASSPTADGFAHVTATSAEELGRVAVNHIDLTGDPISSTTPSTIRDGSRARTPP